MKEISDGIEILVISLPDDLQRRERLSQQFPRYWPNFRIIDGVDLRTPDLASTITLPPPCPRISRKPLTSAETGCAMSHLKALEYATASHSRSILILEDDVLGSDESIDAIAATTKQLPSQHFLLCGGQEGLRGRRYLYGHKRKEGEDYFRLPPIVLRFTARACAYAVSPSMALAILEKQHECLDRADHWRMLLRDEKALYFSQHLSHPAIMDDSHLEEGRLVWKQGTAWKRMWADGLVYTLFTQVLKVLLPIIARVLNWSRP